MKYLIQIIAFFFIIGLSVPAFAQKSGKNGKTDSRAGYDIIHTYKKGIAKVEKNGKQGFIREDGSEIVPCIYDQIYPWEKGRAKVEINGRYGFIRQDDGEEFIKVKYDYIGPFINKLAIVTLNGRRGLINEEGEEVVTLDNK